MNMQRNKDQARPEQLSEAIRDKAQRISIDFEVPLENVLSQYSITLNDPFIKEDLQFKTDAEREEYAIELVEAHFNTAILKSCKYYGRIHIDVLP
jgi:hypothetical protein